MRSPEALSHEFPGVSEAEQKERHADDDVEDGDDLPPQRLGRLVAVADGGDADDGEEERPGKGPLHVRVRLVAVPTLFPI